MEILSFGIFFWLSSIFRSSFVIQGVRSSSFDHLTSLTRQVIEAAVAAKKITSDDPPEGHCQKELLSEKGILRSQISKKKIKVKIYNFSHTCTKIQISIRVSVPNSTSIQVFRQKKIFFSKGHLLAQCAHILFPFIE